MDYLTIQAFLIGMIVGMYVVKAMLLGYDVTPKKKRYRPKRFWQFWR
jgi:hypothetical protein